MNIFSEFKNPLTTVTCSKTDFEAKPAAKKTTLGAKLLN